MLCVSFQGKGKPQRPHNGLWGHHNNHKKVAEVRARGEEKKEKNRMLLYHLQVFFKMSITWKQEIHPY